MTTEPFNEKDLGISIFVAYFLSTIGIGFLGGLKLLGAWLIISGVALAYLSMFFYKKESKK